MDKNSTRHIWCSNKETSLRIHLVKKKKERKKGSTGSIITCLLICFLVVVFFFQIKIPSKQNVTFYFMTVVNILIKSVQNDAVEQYNCTTADIFCIYCTSEVEKCSLLNVITNSSQHCIWSNI